MLIRMKLIHHFALYLFRTTLIKILINLVVNYYNWFKINSRAAAPTVYYQFRDADFGKL